MTIEALKWLLGILLSGWILYLSGERRRIVDDIIEIKKKAEDAFTRAETLGNLVHAVFLTKAEHKDFDNRISASIDRLTERIDKVLLDHGRQ